MNIFGVGLPEMILIMAVGLLVFGPKRLPEIGRSLARTLKSLQDVSKEFEAELKREVDPPASNTVANAEPSLPATAAAVVAPPSNPEEEAAALAAVEAENAAETQTDGSTVDAAELEAKQPEAASQDGGHEDSEDTPNTFEEAMPDASETVEA